MASTPHHQSRVAASLLLALWVVLLAVTPFSASAQRPIAPEDPSRPERLPVEPPTVGPESFRPRSAAAPISYRVTDWAQLIDDTWGASPLTIPQMLQVFDNFWITVDYYFACFQDLNVDWTALRDGYRPEISGGVSRGRFAAIMNHLSLALMESHTNVDDLFVTRDTPAGPNVPLMYIGGWGDNGHFLAGLTPLPDSTLLVYRAISPHPLGLAPGDIVLGYEGIPWKRLHRELLDAELPIKYDWWWGSSESSKTHSLLMSAGMNWHLFSTIDVVKFATEDTLHLSVAPLIGQGAQLDCTEQLPVPGVPMPDYLGANDRVSWGLIDGTRIGYIYVRAWTGNAGIEFHDAIDSLMTEYETTGLIIDFRTNYGGNMFLAYDALALLFNEEVWTIGFAERCDINNHLAMCPSPSAPPSVYVIHGDPQTFYDHPIAVLVGPGAVSAGDQVANLLKFHSRARFFGKTTATAFNAPVIHNVGYPDWSARYARYDAYLVSDPSNYLTHDEFPVDEPVWLTPDDVAQGRDSVVEAAVAWINATSGIAAAAGAPQLVTLQNAPNPVGSSTTIGFTLPGQESTYLRIYDPAGRLVRTLVGGERNAGDHRIMWDRTDNRGRTVPAGVYCYQLEAGGHKVTKKMVVVD